MNIYMELTQAFNVGGLRAILSSGQAVVFHQLAVMSKDGDWILREDERTLQHIRSVLAGRGAHYRFGAPLDLRWMRGGWSSHFEYRSVSLRVRTDFVTRPPRLTWEAMAALWKAQEQEPFPVVGPRDLCELKKTNRERDYAIIGELARLIATGIESLESALDAERRRLIHANEARLGAYLEAAAGWREAWPSVEAEIKGLPLEQAHSLVVTRAEKILPFAPAEEAVP